MSCAFEIFAYPPVKPAHEFYRNPVKPAHEFYHNPVKSTHDFYRKRKKSGKTHSRNFPTSGKVSSRKFPTSGTPLKWPLAVKLTAEFYRKATGKKYPWSTTSLFVNPPWSAIDEIGHWLRRYASDKKVYLLLPEFIDIKEDKQLSRYNWLRRKELPSMMTLFQWPNNKLRSNPPYKVYLYESTATEKASAAKTQ